MHLLSSLNSGFAGAALGWAEIYIRGTNTRATWYASFEGDGPNSSGADITLDAYGSALVYVNQLVDVVVKTPDGVVVKDYGDGYASPNMEVDSQSFTGTDYTGGGAAADKPTTLQSVLDLWKTNSGAIDWKVLIGSTATTLQNALGALNGLVYNVKSPAYGATGDGAGDDLAAIQAALAAAVAAGGGVVFFPVGNYRISAALTWDYRVHMFFMPGAQLNIDSATEKTLKFTGASAATGSTIIYGANLGALQPNTGAILSLEASQKLWCINCVLGANSNSTGDLVSISATQASVEFEDCQFFLWGSTKRAIYVTTGVPTYIRAERCKFITPATYNTVVIDASAATGAWHGLFESNVFDGLTNSTITGGTNMCIRPGAFGDHIYTNNLFLGTFSYALFLESAGRVIGNEFRSSVIAISVSGAIVRAEGNAFTSVTTRYDTGGGTLAAGSYLELDKYEALFSNTTTPTFGANTEFTEFISNTTVPTCTMSNGFYPGQPKRILFRNTSGANWVSVAFAGAAVSRVTSLVALDVAAGAMKMTSWVWTDETTAGSYHWLKYAEA